MAWRIIKGFCVAPLAAALISAVLTLNPFTTLMTTGVAYAAAIVLGVPAYLALRHLGWLRPGAVVGVGAVLGLVVLLGTGWPYGGQSVPSFLLGSALFALNGFVVAAVFWLVALRPQRPNHTIERDARKGGARPSL